MRCPTEARGVINKNVLAEIRIYLVSSFVRVITTILSTIFFLLFLVYFTHSQVIAIFFLFCILAMYIIYRYNLAAAVKQNLYILEGLFHTQSLVYSLNFQEEKLCITIHDEWKAPIYLSYLEFHRVVETQNCYLMMHDGGIPVVIEKKTFRISKRELKDFLIAKGANIRKIKFIE